MQLKFREVEMGFKWKSCKNSQKILTVFSPLLSMLYLATFHFPVFLFHFAHFSAQLQDYLCRIIKGFLHIQEQGVGTFDVRGKRHVDPVCCTMINLFPHLLLAACEDEASAQLCLQHRVSRGM